LPYIGKKQLDRRIRYGTILLLFLVGSLFTYEIFFSSPGSDRPTVKTDLAISAGALARAFDQNEALSDSLFRFKTLLVSGVIQSIRIDQSGSYIATLGGSRPGGTGVDCRLDSQFNQRYSGLKAGDSIRLAGICEGQLEAVIMVECVIQP
jgi:hypothetical protein